MTQVQQILLDGIPTLKLTRGRHLVGYLRSTGWIGIPPSDADLLALDPEVLESLGL